MVPPAHLKGQDACKQSSVLRSLRSLKLQNVFDEADGELARHGSIRRLQLEPGNRRGGIVKLTKL
jgi:hypothetical protein